MIDRREERIQEAIRDLKEVLLDVPSEISSLRQSYNDMNFMRQVAVLPEIASNIAYHCCFYALGMYALTSKENEEHTEAEDILKQFSETHLKYTINGVQHGYEKSRQHCKAMIITMENDNFLEREKIFSMLLSNGSLGAYDIEELSEGDKDFIVCDMPVQQVAKIDLVLENLNLLRKNLAANFDDQDFLKIKPVDFMLPDIDGTMPFTGPSLN